MKYFTKQWRIESNGSMEKVDAVCEKYDEYWNVAKTQIPDDFALKKVNLHDSIITDAYYHGKDFVMEIDSVHGFTDVCKVIFQNASIDKFEFHPNLSWEHNEIYQVDGRYEIQFLTQYGWMAFVENQITADAVLVTRR